MLDKLLTEQRNPASEGIDARPVVEILRIINEEDRKVAESVALELGNVARAVDGIVERFSRGGRLFYIGAGTSGRLGVLDAAECKPTFNVPPELVQGVIAGGERALSQATEASEDDPVAGARDLLDRGFTSADALAGIAASGRTPYVLGAIDHACSIGALTIGISCTPDSELARRARIAITPLPGPEVVTGSTRMKAGTATKLVLNMLTTASMIRMGYVFGNLMVNVRPVNDKLRARARRIIAQEVPVGDEAAGRLLLESGDHVPSAIVMGRRRVSLETARALLTAARGRVSAALEIELNG
jgi:N-acetylmuramic acid 6-phosphate etherase